MYADVAVILGLMFLSVLLHEFGHCFAARRVDGDADEILLWPLGGLARCDVPNTAWANFILAAGGPAVNLVLCLLIYFLGHLAPFVVRVTESASGGTVGVGLVGFLGKLFDVLLPALEFYNMGPAIIREAPLDLWQFAGYVGVVFGYSLIYTAIALLVGLLLFEDRDLA